MNRYIAFDVETPNGKNDRISAIGVTVLENGSITERFSSLVNPETWFDIFNTALTGISPADTADAPTFPELWQLLRPLLDSGLPVAHNAPFDLSVLAKCLSFYKIRWHPSVPYLCTCRMARALLPELPDHRLNTLCTYFNFPIDHHRAASDSDACALLLGAFCSLGAEPVSFERRYDLTARRTLPRGKDTLS